jgi:Kef-type K+ transport system membrane component KefB
MSVPDFIHSHAVALPPIAKFALAMGIIVGFPALSRRVRIPGVVGLLLSGVVMGPHVLGLFAEHHPVVDFLAELGKLLLMFSAGMEINLALFRQAQRRSMIFWALDHLASPVAWYHRWVVVGLSIRFSSGIRLLTRLPYPFGVVDHSPTWGNRA